MFIMENARRIVFAAVCLLIFGCNGDRLPNVTGEAKIQINVPAEAFPGTKTHLITFDLEHNRNIFYNFYKNARKVGMCSPTRLETREKSFEVMNIFFWGQAVERRITFYILRTQLGQWSTKGYGGVEIYDHPEGFPEYRYSKSALDKIKKWYEKNVPLEYQKIALSNSIEYRAEYPKNTEEIKTKEQLKKLLTNTR